MDLYGRWDLLSPQPNEKQGLYTYKGVSYDSTMNSLIIWTLGDVSIYNYKRPATSYPIKWQAYDYGTIEYEFVDAKNFNLIHFCSFFRYSDYWKALLTSNQTKRISYLLITTMHGDHTIKFGCTVFSQAFKSTTTKISPSLSHASSTLQLTIKIIQYWHLFNPRMDQSPSTCTTIGQQNRPSSTPHVKHSTFWHRIDGATRFCLLPAYRTVTPSSTVPRSILTCGFTSSSQRTSKVTNFTSSTWTRGRWSILWRIILSRFITLHCSVFREINKMLLLHYGENCLGGSCKKTDQQRLGHTKWVKKLNIRE